MDRHRGHRRRDRPRANGRAAVHRLRNHEASVAPEDDSIDERLVPLVLVESDAVGAADVATHGTELDRVGYSVGTEREIRGNAQDDTTGSDEPIHATVEGVTPPL